MNNLKLYLIVLGGKPKGRNVEQHDVLFAVGESIEDTIGLMKKHWDTAVHMDAYMAIEQVDGYQVTISKKKSLNSSAPSDVKLFFVNLGGYKPNDLEEYHKKLVIAAKSVGEAKTLGMKDQFFSEGLQEKNARPHFDDKFGMFGFDVDDTLIVDEQIAPEYSIILKKAKNARFDANKKVPGYKILK